MLTVIIMLLRGGYFQEPTSGLDSSTASSLMKQIKHLAVSSNKMVILTLHQPSSQIYKTIESLLLLTHGQVIYVALVHII